ncbi:hypothetical protein HNY73_019913 [Argiope bruennichi]|uniref:Uncharacterized protein n=1 Tax=Argiope bruennichi TaxID=94029 RepID=A0A8T0E543_ARGBR|nr:hypothetical protein HNY73_019913 [Argiope bruennichi]
MTGKKLSQRHGGVSLCVIVLEEDNSIVMKMRKVEMAIKKDASVHIEREGSQERTELNIKKKFYFLARTLKEIDYGVYCCWESNLRLSTDNKWVESFVAFRESYRMHIFKMYKK